MKKYTTAVVGIVVISAFAFASCSSNKKTLGCPGMITKANEISKVVHS